MMCAMSSLAVSLPSGDGSPRLVQGGAKGWVVARHVLATGRNGTAWCEVFGGRGAVREHGG